MLAYILMSALGYLLICLMTARVAYTVERNRVIVQARDWYSVDDPLQHFREQGKSGTAVLSLVYGLAWPVVIPAYLCHRCATFVITSRPRRSPYERALRAKALDARIRELEESLDLRADDAAAGRRSGNR